VQSRACWLRWVGGLCSEARSGVFVAENTSVSREAAVLLRSAALGQEFRTFCSVNKAIGFVQSFFNGAAWNVLPTYRKVNYLGVAARLFHLDNVGLF